MKGIKVAEATTTTTTTTTKEMNQCEVFCFFVDRK
jgi:hypothetical protein